MAKQAGLKDGDVIVAVDGQPTPTDESHFMAQVRLNHLPGDKVKLTLLRSGQREDVLICDGFDTDIRHLIGFK